MAIGRSYAPVWVAAVVCLICLLPFAPSTQARVTTSVATGAFGTVDASMAGFRVGLKTDDETIQKEEEAINPDGLSVKEQKLAEEVEEFEFQAETHRLLDILVHSLYQNKDIFLRELISNASDALDKIRFLSLSDPEALGDSEESRKLEIKVSFDKEAGTLTIQDSGVGMTKQDLIQNLGTVAKSGTAAFVEQMASGADVSLIGQFGVGFYSGYLVADKVTVASKNNDDDQYIWESAADGTFSVAEDDGEPIARGTRIVLHLKEDALEYAEQQKLDELLKRYSQFITFPIYLNKSRTESVEVPVEDEEDDEEPVDDEDDEETDDGDDEEADELEAEDDEEEDDAPRTRTETRTVWEWVQVNNQKAIWTRSKNDISDEEYNEFFKSISKETDDPLAWTHFSAEGEIEFKSILFTPKKAPMGMFDDYYGKNANLRLYVRKVLISDEFEDFLPRYLNFVRGVVDSDDLPLNVSRESLQQSKVLKVMSKKLIRKVLEMLRKLAQKGQKDEEDDDEVVDAEDEEGEEEHPYITFWKEFGKNIKLGLIEDSSNRTKLSKLLRYKSTKSGEEGFVSLDEYVARMKDWQKSIYYIAGENMDAVKDSMFLERFAEKDVEVLFMTEPIDEYALQNLAEYDGHKLQSITKENLKFGDEGDQDKKRQEIYQENFAPLITFMKDTLGDKIEKAVISPRLAKSPCALVTGQYGYSANMERIMKAQAFADPSRAQYMISKKTLEINPRHPVIAELNRRVASEDEAETEQAQVTAQLLFDSALLTSGFSMDDPKDFAMRMHELMKRSLNLESLDLEAEVEVPEEEEEDDEEEEEEEDLDEEEGDDEDEEADEEDEDATGHEEL